MNTILESFLTIGTVKIFIPLVPPLEPPQVPPQVPPLVPLLVPSKVTTQHLRCYMHLMLFYRTQEIKSFLAPTGALYMMMP